MRALLPIAVIAVLGIGLSGCVVEEVASAGIGVATTVVTTTAHVAGDVVSGAADTISGSDDKDSDKDKDKDSDDAHHHHGDDDDSDK